MKKKGVTLIELVLVIAIIGIIAAMILPRFINLTGAAHESKEDAVIGALKEAVAIYCMNNIVNGTGDWPTVNPFTLLNPSVPDKNWNQGPPEPGNLPSPDGVTWRRLPGVGYWSIYCPHYNGGASGGGATIGRMYRYYYSSVSGFIAGQMVQITKIKH